MEISTSVDRRSEMRRHAFCEFLRVTRIRTLSQNRRNLSCFNIKQCQDCSMMVENVDDTPIHL